LILFRYLFHFCGSHTSIIRGSWTQVVQRAYYIQLITKLLLSLLLIFLRCFWPPFFITGTVAPLDSMSGFDFMLIIFFLGAAPIGSFYRGFL
jgi:hypothetical protein